MCKREEGGDSGRRHFAQKAGDAVRGKRVTRKLDMDASPSAGQPMDVMPRWKAVGERSSSGDGLIIYSTAPDCYVPALLRPHRGCLRAMRACTRRLPRESCVLRENSEGLRNKVMLEKRSRGPEADNQATRLESGKQSSTWPTPAWMSPAGPPSKVQ